MFTNNIPGRNIEGMNMSGISDVLQHCMKSQQQKKVFSYKRYMTYKHIFHQTIFLARESESPQDCLFSDGYDNKTWVFLVSHSVIASRQHAFLFQISTTSLQSGRLFKSHDQVVGLMLGWVGDTWKQKEQGSN